MPNGNAVLNFSVATNFNFKNKDGEKIEQTEFHNVVNRFIESTDMAMNRGHVADASHTITGFLHMRNGQL